MIQQALAGLKVLDLTHYIAGPYCTKLLADYGAEVVKIERPGGDGARRLGPFPKDVAHAERSGIFLHLNTNKRSVGLDLRDAKDRALLEEMVAWADVVAENFRPGVMDRLGLGYERLSAINPGLVMVSISDFGQTGPYRDYRGSEIVDYAIGGCYHVNGQADREPLKLGGSVVQYLAGAHAAAATMVALLGRPFRDHGDHIDISIAETQAGSPDRRSPMLVGYQYTGEVNRRGRQATHTRPCKDGYVNVLVTAMMLERVYDLIGKPELKRDPRFQDPASALRPENREDLEAMLLEWLMERTKAEIWALGQKAHVMTGPVYTVAELLEDPHFRQRGYWEIIDHSEAGQWTYPGLPFQTFGAQAIPRRPAPTLGEHDDEVRQMFVQRRTPRQPLDDTRSWKASGGSRLPLEGVRVVDLTGVFAGTHAVTLLADWGAEVIRVEPLHVNQTQTRGPTAPAQAMIDVSRNWLMAYPDWRPGERPWNRRANFQCHARNKLSMTLNLPDPEALDILLRLVSIADLVVENNVPETIDKLGVGYEVLRKAKPDIVMVRMPAYGLTGPYRDYRSMGAQLEGTAGHCLLRGYPDADPSMTGDTFFGDAIAAVTGAMAAAMALYQTRRTGKGQLVELAQTETLIPLFGEYLLDYQMNDRLPQPQGNDYYRMAPHNVYPCSGDDQWIAIAVGRESEWRGLLRTMGAPEWGSESRFASKEGRYEQRRELDTLVADWTRQYEGRWLMERLQRNGVPAGVLNDEAAAYGDPHLNARGFFEELTHVDAGTHRYPGIVWKMARTPNAIRTPPCTLGEHNDYVYRDLLQVSDDEYDRLKQAGHIGTRHHPGVR
ncbi:MAG: CoA transferase [Chloroflexi bacterium]|nr:CoA transferase [Chloroflexota bacterium]